VAGDLDQSVARVPLLIAALGLAGSAVAWYFWGIALATAFLVGSVAVYLNFRLIERFVNRLLRAVASHPLKPPRRAGIALFLQLALFILGAFVIIHFSGLNIAAVLYGFLVCPAAVMLEAIYYLLTYGHS
jgi:hypothetical protein